ncbi:MAG: hypothetical protein ABMA64_37085 [Myxococcota bacterium]
MNTLTLEATVAALVWAGSDRVDARISHWLHRWAPQVQQYGVAYFHLDLDELLADETVRRGFLALLSDAQAWVETQGAEVPADAILSAIGGDHWADVRLSGWPTAEIVGLLSRLREMILSANPGY